MNYFRYFRRAWRTYWIRRSSPDLRHFHEGMQVAMVLFPALGYLLWDWHRAHNLTPGAAINSLVLIALLGGLAAILIATAIGILKEIYNEVVRIVVLRGGK
ncbi:hypothetical protein [Paraburkholderia ferrariae]|uniref:hypothetical protein n=1 Tax=Paraburkholderia ferrariae TaxID=386056 RepID=UPI0012EB67E2|nr:hypothetical protein [Paraburkholderia ferrariae]